MTTAARPVRSMSRTRKYHTVLYHVLVILVSVLMLYPLLWMIASSFKANSEIFVSAGELIPRQFTVENYVNGWRGFSGLNFGVFFTNSFIVSFLGMIGSVFSAAVVAFGFARLRFKGRQLWFTLMILTMMLPGQVMMIPRFVMFSQMGWVGTLLPLTVPHFFGGGFNIFLVMQFIRGIPKDMDEAAVIDGCNWYKIFFRIVLPLIVPALVTVAVLTFINSWGDFMGSLLYLNKPRRYTVALALKLFSDASYTDFGATFAMSVLSLVPILILFFLFLFNSCHGAVLTALYHFFLLKVSYFLLGYSLHGFCVLDGDLKLFFVIFAAVS